MYLDKAVVDAMDFKSVSTAAGLRVAAYSR
jgi:hypothetical protein